MKKAKTIRKSDKQQEAVDIASPPESDAPDTVSSESEAVDVSSDETVSSVENVLDVRNEPREQVELKTIVQMKTSDDTWKETAVVNSVSRAGAGFNITKPCAVGRLMTMVLPLPISMRAYDFHERLYPVMALVQYCHEVTIVGETSYNVGAAFIGKKIPKSYVDNPEQSYRLCGMSGEGLWQVVEAVNEFQVRKHSRFWVEVEVSVTILQKDKKAVCKDVSTTQDISAGGASLRSSVEANIGDKVKFTCKKHNFFSMAVVRGRSVDGSDQPTLHLEFVDKKFPVHLLPKQDGLSESNAAMSASEPVPIIGTDATAFAV